MMDIVLYIDFGKENSDALRSPGDTSHGALAIFLMTL